ncbi:hypothetical protein [Pectobacterium brasiliense]|uniref:hypothetical protein n=1 Tax=Pectobacterium brasiliense TaxID=180957 RepID=UPI0006950246
MNCGATCKPLALRHLMVSYPPVPNELILTRLGEDTDIAALMAELDGCETERAGWVEGNGELTLTGDWLRRAGC